MRDQVIDCIRPDYTAQQVTETYVDHDALGLFQLPTYDFAADLGRLLGVKRLIDIGCGRGYKTSKYASEFEIFGFDREVNTEVAAKAYGFGTWAGCDFDQEGFPFIAAPILASSVIICADVIEHLNRPDQLLWGLKDALAYSVACVMSTPERIFHRGENHLGPPPTPLHAREWTTDEFRMFLAQADFNFLYISRIKHRPDHPGEGNILAVVSDQIDAARLLWAEMFYQK